MDRLLQLREAGSVNITKEVLAILGDDATPEKAAVDRDETVDWFLADGGAAEKEFAVGAWMHALAAAAIREAEAKREVDHLFSGPNQPAGRALNAANKKLTEAILAYDRLRERRMA